MKRLLSLVAFFATLQASAQQVNPVPDYVFRNQMSVGRNAVTDTAAYFSIGPRYGANKGFMPPIVGDTATFSSGKRNGLLIFSVQKNKFLYWDSVRVQWSDMAGSSGTYITGSGITGYVPQFSGTTTIDTSGLFTLGSRLGIGTSSFAYTSATSSIELNGTSGGILGFKRNDSARGYLWHTGDNMELANTTAGAISFNTNSATRGSISSAGVWRLHNLAGTGDRVVVASSNGTLSASTSVTGLVDTTTISTRAWRQKGDDSLGAIIATKGSGTVTSVATGYGLSGGTITTTGTLLVDTLNIATRAWRQKGLDSLAALEVSGSGTTNYIPKFTASTTIGNSQIFDNGTNVGVGTASPSTLLHLSKTGAGVVGPNLRLHNTSARQIGNTARISFAPNADYTSTAIAGFIDVIDTDGIPANPAVMVFGIGSGGSPSERLRITSGGNVGIGTTSPNGKLDVANAGDVAIWATATSAGSAALYLYPSGGGVAQIASVGAVPLQMLTNGAERMRILANGRIGVNTTTDAGYQFNVNGTFNSGANYSYFGGDANTAVYMGSFSNEGRIGVGGRSSFPTAALTFYTADGTNNFERMRITSAGNVGIGTTTPQRKVVSEVVAANDFNYAATSANLGVIGNWVGYLYGFAGNTYQKGATFFESIDGNARGKFHIAMNDAATSANVTLSDARLTVTSAGNVGIGTTSPSDKTHIVGSPTTIDATFNSILRIQNSSSSADGNQAGINLSTNSAGSGNAFIIARQNVSAQGTIIFGGYNASSAHGEYMRITPSSELLINTTTDAGDYKLQVVGNARVGTGKLDISSNTTFSMNVQRSGTSEVAGTFNNSNAILYLGAESSAGGAIFTGSSSYAAVIGSGAAYPLQFATNNVTRATINTNGELLINTTTDNGDFKLQVYGNALISGSIKTANGASSTAQPWHLGSVVATNVQLDTANYVEVEINGVYYRLAIVTPL